jgi:hypothetical protein
MIQRIFFGYCKHFKGHQFHRRFRQSASVDVTENFLKHFRIIVFNFHLIRLPILWLPVENSIKKHTSCGQKAFMGFKFTTTDVDGDIKKISYIAVKIFQCLGNQWIVFAELAIPIST